MAQTIKDIMAVSKAGLSGSQKPEKASQQASSIVMRPTAAVAHLRQYTPKTFLAAYSPAMGAALIERGFTVGRLAQRCDIPTLSDVIAHFGDGVALNWLQVHIYKLEEQAALVLSTDSKDGIRLRGELARMIIALYKDFNLGELSLFFARYIAGEFIEATSKVVGASKVYVALRSFANIRQADICRVEREKQMAEYWANWERMNANACTREEYLKSVKEL